MKFKFVNEGSRCEKEITYGNLEVFDCLVSSYIEDRELLLKEEGDKEYVDEFLKMEFGGITEECFCEISFGEEDSVFVYLLKEDSLEGNF
jgi:hypothetical protein